MGVPQRVGITPQPSVGLCGDTHLERCSQELDQWITDALALYCRNDLDLETDPVKAENNRCTLFCITDLLALCRYVQKASFLDFTTELSLSSLGSE